MVQFKGLTYRWTIKLFKNPLASKMMEPTMRMVLKSKISYFPEGLR